MDKTGITNYKLAKKLGVSQTSISNWRSGERVPRKKLKENVLKLFGVTESDLKGDDFPKICLCDEQKEKPHAQSEGLSKDLQEIIELYDKASPQLRAAALAVLKSAESAQIIPGDGEEDE